MSSPYRTRRTVKPGLMDPARPVPAGVLREILEDANWAPTHGLTQPWRFHVFLDDARERLATALETIYDRITANPREDKRAKLRRNALGAPVVIAVGVRMDPRISELDEIAAAACAVQNLMLSAHERGLGTFWATPPAACGPEFAAWLGDADRTMGVVFVGYAVGAVPASSRVPIEDRVTFHSE